MIINSANSEILNQLQSLIEDLNGTDYSKQITVLSGNSIGKHIRHILECYYCLITGLEKETIDYDLRKRDLLMETDKIYALDFINNLKHQFSFLEKDKVLTLNVSFSSNSDEKTSIATTYYRELAYNIEHAIHHLAIIKIAIESEMKYILLPKNFGVAYSTVKHQQAQCAQ